MTTVDLPHAVLFDLDGTLVDTVGTRVDAWSDVFSRLGIASDREHLATLMGSDGRFLARQVALRAGRELSDAEASAIDHLAGARFGELNRQPRALPGARQVLEYLDAAGVPWAIATSSRPEQVQVSVDAVGLGHQPFVADGSHVAHAKPAPDLLLATAEQMGIAPRGAWYVGDSVWDMRAAVAAGMTAVGITTGATSEDALREAGAEVTYRDLLALLETLGGEVDSGDSAG
jgi:HAD superfamily hydrolase (TIGR01509 family)